MFWGEQKMLAILLLLVLAVNGGLFTGTIMYSAYKAAHYDQTISFIQKMWQPA
jgi:hypothetical protein